ncbi:MAG TPA: VWA domain-containing protein [Gemmatimonadales bacterium]|nr:VWA domain-containing protein [Gemmatimonadales bacterium]
MTFARPFLLVLLLGLPVWWWVRRRRLGRAGGIRMSDVGAAAGAAARRWPARLPVILRSLGVAAWIIAAAGPRIGVGRSEVRSEGISIVLAVDVSSSMLSQDFAPADRIDVAKATAIDFVRHRPDDRIGLVAFAAQALSLVPVTTDYGVLEQALGDLHVGTVSEDGTAIGTAIGTAASRLRRAPGRSKVVVLLTDGVNNRGIDPRTAAQAAAVFGVRIYTIGVGTEGEAPVPTGQGLEGMRYQTMPVELDEKLLGDVATATGGRYFRATDSQSLREIFAEIDRLEKTPVRQVVSRRYDESFRLPLAVGLLALALEIALSATLAVRVP